MKNECDHKKWTRGHCAEMSCANYVNKCPKHSLVGSDKEKCSSD